MRNGPLSEQNVQPEIISHPRRGGNCQICRGWLAKARKQLWSESVERQRQRTGTTSFGLY